MLTKIAKGLRESVGCSDEDLLIDEDLLRLAAEEGLTATAAPIAPPAIGMLADGHVYVAEKIGHPMFRALLAYTIARLRLFGHEDSTIMLDPPIERDARRIRAWILAGYLLLGPTFDVDIDASDLAEVASVGEVPLWYVRLFCQLVRKTRAEAELWKDPELGRRVRALARAQGLTAV